MKKLTVILSLITAFVVLLSSCGLKDQEMYYDYDITEYITVGDYSLKVEKSSDEYDEYYHNYYVSTFGDTLEHTVDKGVVEKWDTVKISYIGYYEGEAFQGGTDNGVELTVGSNTFMIDGFEKALIGKEIGKTVTLEGLVLPQDYYIANLVGKEVVFEVAIYSAVKNKVPGEVDAKQAGFDSVDAYEQAAKEYATGIYIFNNIYDVTSVEVYPKKETQAILDGIITAHKKQCEEKGTTLEEYVATHEISMDKYKTDLLLEIQKSSIEMPRDLVSYYVLQMCDEKLTSDDIKEMRQQIEKSTDTDSVDNNSEINVQRRAAFNKAIKLLNQFAEV